MTTKSPQKRLAVIGLGGQARSELIPAILQQKTQAKIVALCDINQEFIDLAQKIIPNANKVKVFHDYQDLFAAVEEEDFSLDGVVISVPHFLHAEIAELAIKNNIAIFKEKPFALNLQEAQKLGNLAIKEKVQVYTVTKRQFYPSYSLGAQLLQENIIGTPYMYSGRHFIPHGDLYEGWRSTFQTAGGGVLIDMGYHLLDVILRYFGEVSQANLHWTNIAKPDYTYEVEDAASLHNWHPIGVQGVFQLAVLSGPKEESLEIRGTKGKMIVGKNNLDIYNNQGKKVDNYIFETGGVEAVSDAIGQFLLNDRSIWSQNISHNNKIMRLIDKAYKNRK